MLQTEGTGIHFLLQNDRQRAAGGDWDTTWTDIFASHRGSQFDCPSIVYISSWACHDFHSVVEPVIVPQPG